MQAQQERFLLIRVSLDFGNGAIAQKIGEVAGLLDGRFTIPQVVFVARVKVRVIIDRTAADTPETIVAALRRPECREHAQVPLADEGGGVAGGAEKGGQGRVLRRQPDMRFARQRFLQPDRQAILIAPGDQRGARG